MQITLLLVAHITLVILCVVRMLYREDLTPSSRLAWILVALTVPVFGLIIYWFFGEIDLGDSLNRRAAEIKKNILGLNSQVMNKPNQAVELIAPEYQAPFTYATSINGFSITQSNSIELMADAATARQRLLEDIEQAKKHVHVLYYIWLTDQTGTDLAEALIRAAKRGVSCKAIADGMGSRQLTNSALWQRMTDAGVETAVAFPLSQPIKTILFSRIDLRNHRKITVIDGHITHCGSQNCADPEFLPKQEFAPWIDIMLRVQGPVVAQNQLLFASDWLLHKTNAQLSDFDFSIPGAYGDAVAQILGDGPTERRGATPQLFATLMHQARESLTISTPYFVPSPAVLEALCATALRGIHVDLILPAKNDSWVVAATSQSYYGKLLAAGVRIHLFNGGLLHAKTLTIDGQTTLIGSSNMDLRSFDLNYENDILIYDANTTRAIKQRQLEYKANSSQLTLEDIDQWSYVHRMWNNAVATMGPIL